MELAKFFALAMILTCTQAGKEVAVGTENGFHPEYCPSKDFDFTQICNETCLHNIEGYTITNFWENFNIHKQLRHNPETDREFVQKFMNHKEEIVEYLRKLSAMEDMFKEAQLRINRQIFQRSRLVILGRYLDSALHGRIEIPIFQNAIVQNHSGDTTHNTVYKNFAKTYSENINYLYATENLSSYLTEDMATYILEGEDEVDLSDKEKVYFHQELCGIYALLPDIIDEVVMKGINNQSSIQQKAPEAQEYMTKAFFNFLNIQYHHCDKKEWQNAIDHLLGVVHAPCANTKAKCHETFYLPQLPTLINIIPEIYENIDSKGLLKIHKLIQEKDLLLMNIRKQFQGPGFNTIHRMKDVNKYFFSHSIMKDLDDLPSLIIQNKYYPKDLENKPDEQEEFAQNLMVLYYHFYTYLRQHKLGFFEEIAKKKQQKRIEQSELDGDIPLDLKTIIPTIMETIIESKKKIPEELTLVIDEDFLNDKYPAISIISQALTGKKEATWVQDIVTNIEEKDLVGFLDIGLAADNQEIQDVIGDVKKTLTKKIAEESVKDLKKKLNQIREIEKDNRKKLPNVKDLTKKLSEVDIEDTEIPELQDTDNIGKTSPIKKGTNTEDLQTQGIDMFHRIIKILIPKIDETDSKDKVVPKDKVPELDAEIMLVVGTLKKILDNEENPDQATLLYWHLLKTIEAKMHGTKENTKTFIICNGIKKTLTRHLILRIQSVTKDLAGLDKLLIWKDNNLSRSTDILEGFYLTNEETHQLKFFMGIDILIAQIGLEGETHHKRKEGHDKHFNRTNMSKNQIQPIVNNIAVNLDEQSESSAEESDEEEQEESHYISDNKVLLFYPQIEFSLKMLELYKIFDTIDQFETNRMKDGISNQEKRGVHGSNKAEKILGDTFFKIHVMILEARLDMYKKKEYPHDPLEMVYHRALNCMQEVKNNLDNSLVKEDKKPAHCRMSYVDYESFVMMFKYLQATTHQNLKLLEFEEEYEKNFLVNTAEMKILMKNHDPEDMWTVDQNCKNEIVKKDNLQITQQLCAELHIATIISDQMGRNPDTVDFDGLYSEEMAELGESRAKLCLWNALDYEEKVNYLNISIMFNNYFRSEEYETIGSNSDKFFKKFMHMSKEDIEGVYADWIRLRYSNTSQNYTGMARAVHEMIPENTQTPINDSIEKFMQHSIKIKYKSHSHDVHTAHSTAIIFLAQFTWSKARTQRLLQMMGPNQVWMFIFGSQFEIESRVVLGSHPTASDKNTIKKSADIIPFFEKMVGQIEEYELQLSGGQPQQLEGLDIFGAIPKQKKKKSSEKKKKTLITQVEQNPFGQLTEQPNFFVGQDEKDREGQILEIHLTHTDQEFLDGATKDAINFHQDLYSGKYKNQQEINEAIKAMREKFNEAKPETNHNVLIEKVADMELKDLMAGVDVDGINVGQIHQTHIQQQPSQKVLKPLL